MKSKIMNYRSLSLSEEIQRRKNKKFKRKKNIYTWLTEKRCLEIMKEIEQMR